MIERLDFSVLCSSEIRDISVLDITERVIYEDGKVVDNGLRDERMGPTSRRNVCVTCGMSTSECDGHFGRIEFSVPLFHISRMTAVVASLKSRCRTCGSKLSKNMCDKCQKPSKYASIRLKKNEIFVEGVVTPAHELSTWLGDDKRLLLDSILVPPNSLRPPPTLGGEEIMGEDATTRSLLQIMRSNHSLTRHVREDDPPHVIASMASRVQKHVNVYMDRQRATKIRGGESLADRFRGKSGRFRGNAMGKRCNYSARTVVTGDALMDMRDVGIPRSVANTLTVSETVNCLNLAKLSSLNSSKIIKYISRRGTRIDTRRRHIYQLEVGDVVERPLQDGDLVLFNRQPSLHKMSIMCHRALILPYSTFRLNLSCTTPYNADFDGDEMNLHALQTIESRAEAMTMMSVANNFITPASHRPVMSVVQDTLLGMYELTSPDTRLSYAQMCMWHFNAGIERPMPERRESYTGLEAASLTLPPDLNYTRGNVVIRSGTIVSGRLRKNVLGRSDGSLIHCVVLDYGGDVACEMINRMQRGIAWWLQFSIGMSDLVPDPDATHRMQKLCDNACWNIPREDEFAINSKLNSTRDAMGRMAVESMSPTNRLRRIVKSGAKGSDVNIMQIMSCVGQQNCEGRRIARCVGGRTLPCFEKGCNGARERGFVRSPYIKGLLPDEFFFHAVGGREGLCDTAVKTSQTGYVQRRLVKSMETLVVQHDKTVRDAQGNVVQFLYGGDGRDGSLIENDGGNMPTPVPARRILRRFADGKSHTTPRVPFKTPNEWVNGHIARAVAECPPMSDEAFSLAMQECERRWNHSEISAGEAVGVLAAQSVGEPVTQLTLNTFHQAGNSAANVTLGVPRFEELINASKNAKVRRLFCKLDNAHEAFRVSNAMRETRLSHLISTFTISDRPTSHPLYELYPDCPMATEFGNYYGECVLSEKEHAQRGLAIVDTIKYIRSLSCVVDVRWSWDRVCPPKLTLYFPPDICPHDIRKWHANNAKRIIYGIKNITDATLTDDGFETTGSNLLDALPVDSSITSDDVFDVLSTLGVEAARSVLFREINRVLTTNGAYVSARHLLLLADWMTFEGSVRGTTRHGQTTVGVIQKASYEQPVETIHSAALHGRSDKLRGVSERLVMGAKPSIGTQLCEIIDTQETSLGNITVSKTDFDDFEFESWEYPDFDDTSGPSTLSEVKSPRAVSYSPPPWAKISM